jgi:ribonuclease P protein component
MGLPRRQRIQRPDEFRRVLASRRKASDSVLTVAAAPYQGGLPRFGLSVSKRVGNAVERNRVKRRLREIIRQSGVSGAWEVVVTARAGASEASYRRLRESLERLLGRVGVPIAGPVADGGTSALPDPETGTNE